MLKKISVEKLYGLYDYSIILNENPSQPHFITGPNGSGKTTLLQAINALYHNNFDFFSSLLFKTFEFVFDEYIVNIDRYIKAQPKSELDDIIIEPIIELECKLTSNTGETIESSLWSAKKGKLSLVKGSIDTLQMYFTTDVCFYISDQRMSSNQNSDDAKIEDKYLIATLKAIEENLNSEFFVSHLNGSILSDDEFYKRKNITSEILQRIQKYGITVVFPYSELQNDSQGTAMLANIEKALSSVQEKLETVDFFADFLKDSCFLNKTFKIHKSLGLRIYATDEDRTILSVDQLSSGEKHIICQLFSLLFVAPDASLVIVDEPEISLHLSWQMQYLNNMRRIIKIKKHQMIVATHSPQVFDAQFELTTDLFEQTRQK